MSWSDNNVTNVKIMSQAPFSIVTPAGSLLLKPLLQKQAASSVCLCVIIQRFVTCIVNRGSASEGRVPATGNDADQNPRFYAPSPLITYWAATEQPPLVISNHGAQTTQILAAKKKLVQSAPSRGSYFALRCILKDAVNCWKSSSQQRNVLTTAPHSSRKSLIFVFSVLLHGLCHAFTIQEAQC